MSSSVKVLGITSVLGIGHAEELNPRYRRTMEDVCVMIDKFCGDPNRGFFAVYDGHGGEDASHLCGEHMHKFFLEDLVRFMLPPKEAFKSAIDKMDNYLKKKQILFNGCTACMCYVTGNSYIFASVGDSRAVLCKDGEAIRMTQDHKATSKEEITRINQAGGSVVMGRVNGFISVSRALGDHCIKQLVISEPYLMSQPKDVTKDEFIIIACDGVWDVLTDQKACDVVRKSLREIGSPQKAAYDLMSAAIQLGSQDNISVILLVLNEPKKK